MNPVVTNLILNLSKLSREIEDLELKIKCERMN